MRILGFIIAATVMLVALAVGFGISPHDAGNLRAFGQAVERWQNNPDFRQVQAEYVELGQRAMSARLCGIPAAKFLLAIRSIPGLPDELGINPTSAAHYDAFTRGPLSAYLHLAREQGTADAIGMIEDLGRRQNLSDDDCRRFLKSFVLPWPVATDDGAVAGLRMLLRDIDAAKPLSIRGNPSDRLAIYTANPATMDPDSQRQAWKAIDDDLRRDDPQLWRTKQVNDFLAGIWAQGYGQVYRDLVQGVLLARRIAQFVVVITMTIAVAALVFRRAVRKASAAL